jgi:hypothetical protein
MANDFILITVNAQNQSQASQLKNLASVAAQVYSMAAAVRNKMTHMNTGSDFTRIETEFGLQPGTGQEVFDMVNGALNAMDGTMQTSDFKTMTEKLG